MKNDQRPLEPTAEEIREIANPIIDLLTEFLTNIDERPASANELTPELRAELAAPPPEGPGELEPLLDLTRRASEVAFETAGPSYLAYIPGGGIITAALADLLASGYNRYTGKVTPAPAFVALEASVLRWLCDLFEMPESSQALLTTGGSLANMIALAAARTKYADGRTGKAVVYVGEHGHGSLAKAARTIGVSRHHIRMIPSRPDLRIDLDRLRELVAADRAAGLIPIAVCAAAGTTNTGTIDLLPELADLATELEVWLHVDAAYGGFFQLTERGKKRLNGIERADSITLDPHKSLFLPFGTGALIVRDASDLRRAFTEEADYLQDLGENDELPDFDTLSPELSRDFRGLRLWLPLHLHGVGAFRAALDEKLDLAELAYQHLSADERLELPWEPDLSIIAFRLRDEDDEAQLELLRRINASQRVLISSTRIEGRIYLRLAILSVRTGQDRVREVLEIIGNSIPSRAAVSSAIS